MSRTPTLPAFLATVSVEVYENGQHQPLLTLAITLYIQHREDLNYGMFTRAAQHKLQIAGISPERMDELFFETGGTTSLFSCNPRNLRAADADLPVEAFMDYPELPKRETLMRQRRLLPEDMAAARAMYLKPAAHKKEMAVAA